MKKVKLFWLLPVVAFLLLAAPMGCTKEKPSFTPSDIPPLPPPPPPPPSYPQGSIMVMVAGNVHIAYPAESALLTAYSNWAFGALTFQWKKIAGPAGYKIAHPDSLETRVTNLEVGDYQFEITATNIEGNKQSDTLSVFVIQPGPDETIFKALEWLCPMSCSLTMSNIYSFIPKGVPIRVWIRPEGSASWVEVQQQSQWTASGIYFYDLGDNTIALYADYEAGFADLKIQY